MASFCLFSPQMLACPGHSRCTRDICRCRVGGRKRRPLGSAGWQGSEGLGLGLPTAPGVRGCEGFPEPEPEKDQALPGSCGQRGFAGRLRSQIRTRANLHGKVEYGVATPWREGSHAGEWWLCECHLSRTRASLALAAPVSLPPCVHCLESSRSWASPIQFGCVVGVEGPGSGALNAKLKACFFEWLRGVCVRQKLGCGGAGEGPASGESLGTQAGAPPHSLDQKVTWKESSSPTERGLNSFFPLTLTLGCKTPSRGSSQLLFTCGPTPGWVVPSQTGPHSSPPPAPISATLGLQMKTTQFL
jgi:hypothetical protein